MTTTPDAPGSWSGPSPSSAPPPWGRQSWGQNPSEAQPWSQAPSGGGAPTWGPDPYAPGPGGPPGHVGPLVPPRPTNAWAVTALVTGILAIVPVAIVAGVVALNQTARTGEQGRGMAIAGLVLSALWTMVFLVVAALLASAFLAFGGGRRLRGGAVRRGRACRAGSGQSPLTHGHERVVVTRNGRPAVRHRREADRSSRHTER